MRRHTPSHPRPSRNPSSGVGPPPYEPACRATDGKVEVRVLLHVFLQPLAHNILDRVLKGKHASNTLNSVPYHHADLARLARLVGDVWIAVARRSLGMEADHGLIQDKVQNVGERLP